MRFFERCVIFEATSWKENWSMTSNHRDKTMSVSFSANMSFSVEALRRRFSHSRSWTSENRRNKWRFR